MFRKKKCNPVPASFGLAWVLAPALSAVISTSCQSRSFNKVSQDGPASSGDDGAEGRGAAKTAAFLGALGQEQSVLTKTADGGEDFTWDIDCAAAPKLTFDPPQPGAFDLSQGAPERARSLRTAALLARASFLTYKHNRYIEAEAPKWGFEKVTALEDASTDTQVHVMSNPRSVLVVFRGSSSNRDLIGDIDMVKEREYGWGATHRGFTNAYTGKKREEGIQGRLFEALLDHGYDTGLWTNLSGRGKGGIYPSVGTAKVREKATKELWITGHSLGGALAQIFAADLADRETAFRGLRTGGDCTTLSGEANFVSGVVSFGSPRLGNEEYTRCFDASLRGRNWRVVTQNDIVPQLPWRELRYRHAGRQAYISMRNEFIIDPSHGEKAADMAKAMFSRFVTGDLGAVKAGLDDHFLYPQPLQHMLEPKCLPTRGKAPTGP